MAATMVQRWERGHRITIPASVAGPAGAPSIGLRPPVPGPCSMLRPMPGPVALVGAGEFLAPMAEFDRGLLAATGRDRPRVVMLPTASAPDGEATFRAWAEMGVEHFGSLGAEVEPVLVPDRGRGLRRRRDPGDGRGGPRVPLGRAPGVPAARSCATRRWVPRVAARARARRGGGRVLGGRDGDRRPHRRAAPHPEAADAAAVPGALRHGARADRRRRGAAALRPLAGAADRADRAPGARAGLVVLGIDEDTAVVGRNGAWQVHGAGRVTVWRGRRRERFRRGEAFRA